MRKPLLLNGFENGVAAGGAVTINAGVNRRIHSEKIFYSESGSLSDPTTTGINRIEERVNGVLMTDLTAAQAISIARLDGYVASTGEVPLFKSRPARASVIGEEATSWDMFGQNSHFIKLSIDGAATAPTIEVQQVSDNRRNLDGKTPFLSVMKLLPVDFNANSGNNNLTTIPIDFPIHRILLFAPNAINSVEVIADGELKYEASFAQNARYLAEHGLDQAGSGIAFPIVFDADQQISSPLRVRDRLNVRIDSSATQTVTAIVEERLPAFR